MSLKSEFYLFLLLLITLFGIARYKKLAIPFKLVTIIVGITFVLESISRAFAIIYHDSRPIWHIMSVAEINFYLPIFYFLFRQKAMKKTIIGLIVFFDIFSIVNSFYLQPYRNNFPSNVLLPVQITYAILSLLMFRQMLLNTSAIIITKQSVFWYNSGMLFLSTSLFFQLALSNYFATHNFSVYLLDAFGYYINIIFYPMLGYSIYLNSKETLITNE